MKGVMDYTGSLAQSANRLGPYLKRNIAPLLGDAPTYLYSRMVLHHLRLNVHVKDGQVYYLDAPFSGTSVPGGDDSDADLLAPLGPTATPDPPTVVCTTLHDPA